MVKRGGALVESPRMRRIPESEPLAIKMVTKFVTERGEKGAERSDPLLDRRAHPDADQLLSGMVVSEQLGSPAVFLYSKGARRQDPDLRR